MSAWTIENAFLALEHLNPYGIYWSSLRDLGSQLNAEALAWSEEEYPKEKRDYHWEALGYLRRTIPHEDSKFYHDWHLSVRVMASDPRVEVIQSDAEKMGLCDHSNDSMLMFYEEDVSNSELILNLASKWSIGLFATHSGGVFVDLPLAEAVERWGEMRAHTPGPWIAEKQHRMNTFFTIRTIPGNHYIGELHQLEGATQERIESNAALMAAAPELLASLKDLVEVGRVVLSPCSNSGAVSGKSDLEVMVEAAQLLKKIDKGGFVR